jgi:hypothetical protein
MKGKIIVLEYAIITALSIWLNSVPLGVLGGFGFGCALMINEGGIKTWVNSFSVCRNRKGEEE